MLGTAASREEFKSWLFSIVHIFTFTTPMLNIFPPGSVDSNYFLNSNGHEEGQTKQTNEKR